MDYNVFIDLDNVIIEDCIDMYYKKGMCAVINDGILINFRKEEDNNGEN